MIKHSKLCKKCSGKGILHNRKCPYCDGTGRVKNKKQTNLKN